MTKATDQQSQGDELPDEIFGAASHAPSYWDRHPWVLRSEVRMDGAWGYVQLWMKARLERPDEAVRAAFVEPHVLRGAAPHLHFYGEGACPVALFECAPGANAVLISIEGPIPDDERTCWTVGVWLEVQVAS